MFRWRVPGWQVLIMAVGLSGSAAAFELAPHKDSLFAYPATLSTSLDGRIRTVAYDALRDINMRDEIPERRVHRRYVSLGVRRAEVELEGRSPAGPMRYFAVGERDRPKLITLYLHGMGGSRKQGVDDFTFGGNFNRLKNLMAANGGLYLSPDFPDFDSAGAGWIAALIRHYHARSPSAPVFVACGSMGALLCYRLAGDPAMAGIVRGYVMLGAPPDSSLIGSPAFRARTPVFFGHGTRDRVYPVESIEKFVRQMDARAPGYPVQLVRFDGGSHGTPIRMTDWRATLNWMLGR